MKKVIIIYTLLNFITAVCTAQVNDTVAIKNLLEKESATWRSGDEQAHALCWHIQPYSIVAVSTADGNFFNVPAESVIHPAAGMMGKGGHAVNSHYTFSIHGDAAWVSHNEQSTAADGSISYSFEIRMLEKYNGEWKLTGESIHLYKKEP